MLKRRDHSIAHQRQRAVRDMCLQNGPRSFGPHGIGMLKHHHQPVTLQERDGVIRERRKVVGLHCVWSGRSHNTGPTAARHSSARLSFGCLVNLTGNINRVHTQPPS